jgi:hypothetical protein
MTIQQYIEKINTLYKTGNAREHSYRGDLQNLLMAILPDVLVTNEPARVDCGAPDYVLTRKEIPIGYIEAKDIGVDLGSKTLKEQFDRYKSGLSNLIFTDYMDFHFYKEGEFVTKIAIAELKFPSVGGVPKGRGGRECVHQRHPILFECTRSGLELLHWWLSTRPKMAQRPQRPRTELRRYFALPKNHCGFD